MSDNGKTGAPQISAPHSLEAEEATIGAALLEPSSIPVLVEFLDPDDFFIIRNGWAWDAIRTLWRRGDAVDYLTVVETLRERGQLEEFGGAAYLTWLINQTPSSIYAETYGRIVRAAAVRRRMITAANTIAKLAYSTESDLTETIAAAQAALAEATGMRQESDLSTAAQIVSSVFDDVERRRIQGVSGIPTGFKDLDRDMGGLQPSDLIIVAGRPGMGKTAWLLTVARRVASAGKKVLIVSLEMSAGQNIQRLIAMQSKVSTERQRCGRLTDDEFSAFTAAAGEVSKLPLWVLDAPGMTPDTLRARVKRVHAEHGLDLVMVDYLQLMTSSGRKDGNRVQEVSDISRGLKQLARELDLPVIAAAQLSRAVEQRAEKRPVLADLRESGALEQDADVVLMLYRDDYYNPQSDLKNQCDVIIAKHRNGPVGTVPLYFNRELTLFADLKRTGFDLVSLMEQGKV